MQTYLKAGSGVMGDGGKELNNDQLAQRRARSYERPNPNENNPTP